MDVGEKLRSFYSSLTFKTLSKKHVTEGRYITQVECHELT